ncbi:Hypothetical predicted protein [Lecanosticta acicola]|uniref:BRCT domain-containing protein n=1 Tax=Lecanosticta acicola TaxID=111012 RepID=A0AAI8YZ37_9PEZI|nr:Hypothetical predicted protein [Lecanosticta acicola]
MASLTEDSLPSEHLAQLESLNRRYCGQDFEPNAAGDDARKQHQESGENANASVQLPSTVQESASAYLSPNSSPIGKPKPGTHASHSAPGDLEAMLPHSTPSQEAFAELTKAKSFPAGDVVEPEHDTQEMPSQVYHEEIRKSMVKDSRATPERQQESFPIEESDTDQIEDGDKTQRTVREGETGHIDLVTAWPETSSPARSTQGYDELLEAPNSDSPQTEFKKPPRPFEPATPAPALAGQKHDRNGEPFTSEKSTTKKMTGFSQMFQHTADGILSGTQLFDQTQTRSSPIQEPLRSSPALTRPSPNFAQNEPRMEATSEYGFSSPVMPMTARPSSSYSINEPRGHYTTTKESQERKARKKLERFERDRAKGFVRNDMDEEDESQQRRKSKALQRSRSAEAMADLRQLRAPERLGSRTYGNRKQRETINLVTPAIRRHHEPQTRSEPVDEDLDLLDDREPNENMEDDETVDDIDELALDDDDERGELHELSDNDEYDELGQTLRSQGNEPERYEEDGSVAEGDATDDFDLDSGLQNVDGEAAPADGILDQSHVIQRTQGSTIADSQPPAQHATVERSPRHQLHHSPFVPGSHYEEKTSEEQVILASSQRRSQNRVPASQLKNQAADEDSVPSSPPLQPALDDTLPSNSDEASMQRRELLQEFKIRSRSAEQEESYLPREIPESDRPDLEAYPAKEEESQGSNFAVPYSTARTHVSGSAPSPAKPAPSQASSLIDPSPRKAAGVRHFGDMAGIYRSNSSFDVTADVDAVMNGIMTDDDRMVLAATSDSLEQPRTKRRRLNKEVSSNATTSEANSVLPSTHATSDVEMQGETNPPGESKAAIHKSPDLAVDKEQPDALRDRSSKGNEMATTSTPVTSERVRNETPESRRLREKAGADAASQLISARTAKVSKKAKQVTYGRTVKRKSTINEPAKSKRASASKLCEPDETANEEMTDRPAADLEEPRVDANVEADDVYHESGAMTVESASGDIDVVGPSNASVAQADVIPSAEAPGETDDGAQKAIPAPNRIFALFKGMPTNYYPATWIGGTADGMNYKVRFDDGNVTEVGVGQVRALDLRIGDNVRVDDPRTKGRVWRVAGFGNAASAEERQLGVDVYGRARVKVQAKIGRKGTSKGIPNASNQAGGEIFEVLLEQIFIPPTLWPQLDGRAHVPASATKSTTAAPAQTPSTRSRTPNSETPSSRSRRAAVPPPGQVRGRSKSRASHLREASVASYDVAPVDAPAAIFSGMAFAISYVGNEAEKADVSSLIARNGGTILQDGFEELFELPSLGEGNTSSPKKKSPRKQQEESNEEQRSGLQLKSENENVGFVALIADRHSRKAKYMQALALGLPALSGRWVIDSLDASRNPTLSNGKVAPLAWDTYLLPSGESSYLRGAIRSRTIALQDSRSAELPKTVASRPILLHGESVLIVAPKKGKVGWDKRKTYAFLTLALGAGQVKRVNDLQEAKAVMEQSPDTPKWVYVDGTVAEAEKVLFGKTAAGKKRKRESDGARKEDGSKLSATDGNVRIVNDEFVVQSLVLGALTE